jgi:hypothetical protein
VESGRPAFQERDKESGTHSAEINHAKADLCYDITGQTINVNDGWYTS